ncbi:MAG: fatty acid desaturase [Rhizobiaceae bacterium]
MLDQLPRRIEWPTIILTLICYSAWFWLALEGTGLHPTIWIFAASVLTTLYWSLMHEAVHNHPTDIDWINHLTVIIPIGWVFPYGRFRDGHLRHHATGELTDPFDDPESFYLSPDCWGNLAAPFKLLLRFNNSLFGRMLIGPAIAIWRMIASDLGYLADRSIPSRDRYRIIRDWLLHFATVAALVGFLAVYSNVPLWQFVVAAYFGISILQIRTFPEHQASDHTGERTVIIEDKGPLAFLFLYNNLHIVHHTRPGLAWYRLPGFYRRHRARFIRRNNGYVFSSYWQVLRHYFLNPKEPVPHPGQS